MEEERNTQYDHQQGGESKEKPVVDQVEVKERGLLDTLLGRNKPEEDQEKQQEEALVTGMDNVKVSEPQKHEANKDEHHGVGEKKKKKSLLAKLHRTGSSSSSSSDEEEEVIDDNGEVVKRRKKKKGLKEKIKEKLAGHKDDHGVEEGEHKPYAPAPPVPTHVVHQEAEEHKQPYVPTPPAPAPTYVHQQESASVETTHAYKEHDDDHKVASYIPTPAPVVGVQKVEETTTPEKGLLDKIKEKLPGGHKKPEVDAAAPPAPPHTATEDVSSPDGKEKKQGLLGKIMDRIPGYNKSPAEEEHKPATATGEHKKTSS